MLCAEARREAYPYLDEELESGRRQDVASHLNACDACREWVSAVDGLEGAMRAQHRAVTAPVALRARIQLDLGQARAAGRPGWRTTSAALAAAAAIFLVVFVTVQSKMDAASPAVREMVQLHTTMAGGNYTLPCKANDIEGIRNFLHCNCDFKPCTHDLSEYGLNSVGAAVEAMQSSPGLNLVLTPYQTASGALVTHFCVGSECLRLPEEARRTTGGLTYYVVACDGFTVMLFPTANQLCIFVFAHDPKTETVLVTALAE